jgi:CRISPR/Cas system CMR subunit Cmr4 (Cas7 group RAMP superfamily)
MFKSLPVRQHVRIDDKGAGSEGGKFDEEIVYKGTRFCFELEMIGDDEANLEDFEYVLNQINNETFRIGGGSRRGFGEIRICDIKKTGILDLNLTDDLNKYLEKTSSLNDCSCYTDTCEDNDSIDTGQEWIAYTIPLRADDFFFFGAGYGDGKFVTEKVVQWNEDDHGAAFSQEKILVPGSSVKGALAHRVAFYYNKLKMVTAEIINKSEPVEQFFPEYEFSDLRPPDKEMTLIDRNKYLVTRYNPAVRALFGYTAEKNTVRGNVLIQDIIEHDVDGKNKKVLNHVSIDRFTGGAIDGALFSEEVYGDDNIYTLHLKVKSSAFQKNDRHIREAFEKALDDIKTGMLPLGGGTMRGHGRFNIKN